VPTGASAATTNFEPHLARDVPEASAAVFTVVLPDHDGAIGIWRFVFLADWKMIPIETNKARAR
jgi:hypothetical protein